MSIIALANSDLKGVSTALKEGKESQGEVREKEFDFFNYLMGLQGNLPQQQEQMLPQLGTETNLAAMMKPEASEKNLMDLFNAPMTDIQPEKILLASQEDAPVENPADALMELALRSYQQEGAERLEEGDDSPDGDPIMGLATSVVQQLPDSPVTPNTQNSQIDISNLPMTEIHDRVQSLVSQGGGKMTVALNPPELGQMEIEVITRGGKVEMKMTSDNHMAKHLLEANLPELRRTLGIQELDLARVEVTVGDPGFQSFHQGSDHSGFARDGRPSPSRWNTAPEIGVIRQAPRAQWAARSQSGQLDIQI